LKAVLPDIELYSVEFSDNFLDDCAIELGVYFIMLAVCFFILLDQVRGKPKQIGNWLMFRKLEILQADETNNAKVQKYLFAATGFYLVMPILILAGWVILLAYDKAMEG
jgi:hypothetical protein